MIPRIDPETRPAAVTIQLRLRAAQDPYGVGRKAKNRTERVRPIETRNGIPVKHYRNWSEPRPSMTPDEAEAWLVYRYRSPGKV